MQNPHRQLNNGDSDISDEDFGDVDENIVVSAKRAVPSVEQRLTQERGAMKPQDFNSFQNVRQQSSEKKIQQVSKLGDGQSS